MHFITVLIFNLCENNYLASYYEKYSKGGEGKHI